MQFSLVLCNISSPPLADIVFFGLSLKVFKMRMLGRENHTLIKNASERKLPSKEHFMSGSDTICNSPNPPLANIVIFRSPQVPSFVTKMFFFLLLPRFGALKLLCVILSN